VRTLDAAEIGSLMLDARWSWRVDDLDGYLAELGFSRDRSYGDFPELVMLPLRSELVSGQAGMVHALESGDVMQVSVSLSDVVAKDDLTLQTELDQAAADAKAALVGRFGRASGGKKPRWELGERRFELHRLSMALRLTLVHVPHHDVFAGN
jgi:hypothetical protein